MERPILEVKNLNKSFNGQKILNNISFNVNKGEVVSIIGPSGCGKTTLLRIINQLETIDSGKVTICNDVLYDDNLKLTNKELKKIQLYNGLVFQNFNLFPNFTVLKNITAALTTVLKKDQKEANLIAEKLLKKMNLESKKDSYPSFLSGGEKQRVAIARALALKPSIMFFDEPTSALDPELTNEVLNVIKKLKEDNISMVIVTHEIQFAKEISDNIIFMDKGQIVEEGKDLISNPQNVRTKKFLTKY